MNDDAGGRPAADPIAEESRPVPVGARSGLAALLALQDEDVHADQLAHRRGHLPEQAGLAAVDARQSVLASERRELESQRAELAAREAELERETAEVVARITAIESRARSGGASSYRDQEAMAAEVASLSRRRAELEEQDIEVLVLLDPLDAALARLSATARALEDERLSAAAALEAAATVIDADLAASRQRRGPLLASVPPELLAEYERLRSRLGGVGIARLVRGACSGCHLALPATEVDQLRRAPEGVVSHCEQCGRILVA